MFVTNKNHGKHNKLCDFLVVDKQKWSPNLSSESERERESESEETLNSQNKEINE